MVYLGRGLVVSGILAAVAGGGAPGVIQDIGDGLDAVGVTLALNNDGTYTMTGDPGGNWVEPASAAIAAQWQVKVDVTSGAFTSGTTGTWLAMSSNRGWIEDSGQVIFDISWREAATGTVRKVQTGVSMEKI